MTLLAAARDLPQNVISATKLRSGPPLKTSKHPDGVRGQELRKNHHLYASELKEMHQDHLGNVYIRFIEHRPKKVLEISSQRAASKTLLTPRKRKIDRLQFALGYLHWSVDDRKRVMWSDESTFHASPATNIGHFSAKINT